MSNLHRIRWIDRRIREKKYPNRNEIADKFEISVRQAARDIEYMKYSLGAPIEYSAYKGGYYYREGSSFQLPPRYISEKESKMLGYLAHQYANYKGGQAAQLADLFQKLTDERIISDNEEDVPPVFNFTLSEQESFFRLKSAIKVKKKVRIKYIDSDCRITERTYCPYKLFSSNGNNYVVGYCELRKDLRVFRLDRIESIDKLGDSYEIVSFYNEKEYKGEITFNYRQPYTTVVKIRDYMNNDDMNFKYYYKKIGDKLYEFHFYESEGFISEMLSRFRNFEILSPLWLKRRLLKRIELILQMNKKN